MRRCAMATKAAEFRAQARRCEQKALASFDQKARADLFEAARDWKWLADHAERDDLHRANLFFVQTNQHHRNRDR
jgi:hypothetical protein